MKNHNSFYSRKDSKNLHSKKDMVPVAALGFQLRKNLEDMHRRDVKEAQANNYIFPWPMFVAVIMLAILAVIYFSMVHL